MQRSNYLTYASFAIGLTQLALHAGLASAQMRIEPVGAGSNFGMSPGVPDTSSNVFQPAPAGTPITVTQPAPEPTPSAPEVSRPSEPDPVYVAPTPSPSYDNGSYSGNSSSQPSPSYDNTPSAPVDNGYYGNGSGYNNGGYSNGGYNGNGGYSNGGYDNGNYDSGYNDGDANDTISVPPVGDLCTGSYVGTLGKHKNVVLTLEDEGGNNVAVSLDVQGEDYQGQGTCVYAGKGRGARLNFALQDDSSYRFSGQIGNAKKGRQTVVGRETMGGKPSSSFAFSR